MNPKNMEGATDKKGNIRKLMPFFIIGAMFGLFLALSYFLLRHFLQDRQKALSFSRPQTSPLINQRPTSPRNETKTYTQEDLEKMRKEGKPLPGGSQQPYTPPPVTSANDDAVQRSLRTLEDINRINQMNQRLLEQQQRMQNQK